MDGLTDSEPDLSEYVEVDPTGRYGRYNEVLGRGASKTVYRAFDEYEGIEVAWNQVRVHDFLQSAKDLEMIYCEIHLLKTLKHKNIMKSYTSWIDTSNRQINFITEMFTSGTLRQYRLKHKRVSIRAVKHWCRQILEGLLYLHSHDPPVIHRDLKCDNIFINGNQGEVKIGDLGLAAILSNSHVVHCVGTPEFMAPEMYGKAGYNELVDIYSFGMCILEMVTFEYPYSECTNPAHIYKKVISGKRPNALNKVKDPEVRQFIEKCLGTVSSRLSARELLNDPFLQTDVHEYDLRSIDCNGESDGINPLARQPVVDPCISDCSYRSWNCNSSEYEPYNGERHDYQVEAEASGNKLFDHRDEEEHSNDHMDIAIKGTREEDGNIFLRLRIADKEGQIRNIYFPFDVEMDTALNVATEMVAELEITDQDVTYIAEMIDGEISKLVAEWNSGPVIEEDLSAENTKTCLNCDSTHTSFASCMKLLSSSPDHCSDGHFEEFMPVDGFEHDAVEGEGDKLPTSTKQPNAALELIEKWDCQESVEISSLGSGISQSDDGYKKAEKLVSPKHEIDGNQSEEQSFKSCSVSTLPSLQQIRSMSDDFENEIQWEMRWLKAKLQLEVREIMNQRLRIPSKCSTRDKPVRDQQFSTSYQKSLEMAWRSDNVLASMDFRSPAETTYLSSVNQGVRSHEAMMRGFPYSNDIAVKSLCGSSLLPGVLQRTTSLPVDAVHI